MFITFVVVRLNPKLSSSASFALICASVNSFTALMMWKFCSPLKQPNKFAAEPSLQMTPNCSLPTWSEVESPEGELPLGIVHVVFSSGARTLEGRHLYANHVSASPGPSNVTSKTPRRLRARKV